MHPDLINLVNILNSLLIITWCIQGSVRRSDLGEFIWQISHGGVISKKMPNIAVHSWYEAYIIRQMYRCIAEGMMGLVGKGMMGVVFEEHSWVNVPKPFDRSFQYKLIYMQKLKLGPCTLPM